MRQINLLHNKTVILDDEDFDRLSGFHWSYRSERNGNDGYAIRHQKDGRKYRTVYLHREIMNPPGGHEVVFLNSDRLDCRRENLRVVTKQEARRHHRVRRDSTSGVKGVRFNPDGRTWTANVYRNGHCYSIGNFYRQEEAIAAYDEALRRENPDLFSAPERVDRRDAAAADASNPDAVQSGGPVHCES